MKKRKERHEKKPIDLRNFTNCLLCTFEEEKNEKKKYYTNLYVKNKENAYNINKKRKKNMKLNKLRMNEWINE